jgi:hypothetical protein
MNEYDWDAQTAMAAAWDERSIDRSIQAARRGGRHTRYAKHALSLSLSIYLSIYL